MSQLSMECPVCKTDDNDIFHNVIHNNINIFQVISFGFNVFCISLAKYTNKELKELRNIEGFTLLEVLKYSNIEFENSLMIEILKTRLEN